jgi:hypothetical protein
MLIAAEFQGDRLTEDEIISTAIMTLLAGSFKAIVQRFYGIELLNNRLDWHTSLAFRGLRSLNTRLISAK